MAGVLPFKVRSYNFAKLHKVYLDMSIWKRLAITILVMLIVSSIVGLFWRLIFQFGMPSYVGGVIGGLVAIPVWEYLKRKKR